MLVMIAAGGTGGHIFPAVALAQELLAGGCEVMLLGRRGGLEERAAQRYGLPFRPLRAAPWRGWRPGRAAAFAIANMLGLLAVFRLLRRRKPAVLVAMGGYVSLPALLAARALAVPLVLHEQNAVPGKANRLAQRWARLVTAAYAEAAERFAVPVEIVGNPVRRELRQAAATAGERGDSEHPTLLVLGGSGGARRLNQLALEMAAPLWEAGIRTVIVAGRRDYEWVTEEARQRGLTVVVHGFVEEMAPLYRQSDLALSRAGAVTLAELALFGLPAVLIPFPYATDDHQRVNAQHYERAGAAIVMSENEVDAPGLTRRLADLLGDRERLQAMAQAMKSLARPDSAERLASLVMQLARSGGSDLRRATSL